MQIRSDQHTSESNRTGHDSAVQNIEDRMLLEVYLAECDLQHASLRRQQNLHS